MIFADTNIIIDVLEPDTQWHSWSRSQMAATERTIVNAIVVAECASHFEDLLHLETAFAALDIDITPIPLDAAFHAGSVFRQHRRLTTDRTKILADFLIGAHALSLGATLLTRDTRIFRTYFPTLALITPEDDHG